MILLSIKNRLNPTFIYSLVFLIFEVISFPGLTQQSAGIVKGKITDGSSNQPLYGVVVVAGSTRVTTSADGYYFITTSESSSTFSFRHDGFQSKVVTNISIPKGETASLDIILYPLTQSSIRRVESKKISDSVSTGDTVIQTSFFKESRSVIYNTAAISKGNLGLISQPALHPGIDKDGSQLLKRLNGVLVQDNPHSLNTLQSLNISGLGERYNQVLLNGAVLNSLDPVSRSYPLVLFPTEIIESVSVQKTGNASIPGDFAGGTVEIRTKDFPDQDFFYVLAGAGFFESTRGKDFYSDKRSKWELLGFSGSNRSLPRDFPTTRSQSSLSQKNIQEQVYLSQQLKNNLAPVNQGSSKSNDRILLGYGKIIQLKGEGKIGLLAFLNHQKTELIEESIRQVAPDIAANPYPFSTTKALISSHSSDINYRYASQTGATLNASVLFGRNKISFRNYFGRQFLNTYVTRSNLFKPDEDTSAHAGVIFRNEQRTIINSQLSGEHALGENSRLRINWQAAYFYYRQQNPDERNFLLRQDATNNNLFEIARPSSASLSSTDAMFTNTGRLWREYTDHNFNGAFNLQFPFNMFRHAQVLSGGIYLQTHYRILFSDLLMTKGNGYSSVNDLLAPARYFPGGLSVTNYYTRFLISGGVMNPDAVNASHRGNYTASSNIGASYIGFENKFTDHLSLNWGLRAESNSHLVSTSQYNYFTGYKNAQLGTLDENDRVIDFDFLPSAEIEYTISRNIRLQASYFKTINRPQLQELARFRYYDATSFLVKTGNPLLANTAVRNFEAGINWLPNAATQVSLSGFYKEIDQPVEYILSGYANVRGNLLAMPHNTPPAIIRGLTAAFRINLDFIASWLSPVSVFGNGNWLKSQVAAGPVRSVATPNVSEHTLTGSPGYTVNAGLVIQHFRFPMLTVLYNRTDDYISALGSGRNYLLGNGNLLSAIPDYRVKGRERLDIQVSQKLFRSRLQIIAGVNDLLQNRYIEYQDLNGNGKFDVALALRTQGNSGVFYESGVDNTVLNIKSQRSYYVTVSYLFK